MRKERKLSVEDLDVIEQKFINSEISLEKYCECLYSCMCSDAEPESDAFATYITRLAYSEVPDDKLEAIFSKSIDKGAIHSASVASFFCLCIRYRNRKEFSKFKRALDRSKYVFGDHSLYKYQRMVYKKTYFKSSEELTECFDIWNSLDDRYRELPSFVQGYADAVATYYENAGVANEENKKHIEEALHEVESAISNGGVAKLRSTRGKLLSLLGRYDEAKASLLTAIDKEDPSHKNYSNRINDYQLILSQIKMKQHLDNQLEILQQYEKKFQKVEESIDRSKYETLALLGFFAALLALISGAFRLGGGLPFIQQVQILIILSCCIIAAFSTIRLIMNAEKKDVLGAIAVITLCILASLAALVFVPMIAS